MAYYTPMVRLGYFIVILRSIATRAVSPSDIGPHVYVWQGQDDDLRYFLPRDTDGLVKFLNLHNEIKSEFRTPTYHFDARQILEDLIEGWLKNRIMVSGHHVIVVGGCDLLDKYDVPLDIFSKWASETTIFIFVVPPLSNSLANNLPDCVIFQEERTLNYLKEFISEDAVMEYDS